MRVDYFRPQKAGPESLLEDAVAARIPELFCGASGPTWAAGSLPIGAGLPDLLVVNCHPNVVALSTIDHSVTQILAYLRVVNRANINTITTRVRQPKNQVSRSLDELEGRNVVACDAGGFVLRPEWRTILPEVVSVEVKVSDWRRALSQAHRNQIFSHRSFVALPTGLATRIHKAAVFAASGIGILGVGDNGDISMIRRSTRRAPRVWSYYYRIAVFAAEYLQK